MNFGKMGNHTHVNGRGLMIRKEDVSTASEEVREDAADEYVRARVSRRSPLYSRSL